MMGHFAPLTADQLDEIKRLYLLGSQPNDIVYRMNGRQGLRLNAGGVRWALRGMGIVVADATSYAARYLGAPWPKRDRVGWPVLPALWMDEPGEFTDNPRAALRRRATA